MLGRVWARLGCRLGRGGTKLAGFGRRGTTKPAACRRSWARLDLSWTAALDRKWPADEGRTRHATWVKPDFRRKSQEPARCRLHGSRTIGHKAMPNIDTPGANRAGRRLRAALCWDACAPRRRGPRSSASNGNFYTAADDQPRAEAVVVVDGRITFVGKTPDALRRAPLGARRIDLPGATVLPGLTDAHAHLSGIGERELTFTPGGNDEPRGPEKQAARACTPRQNRHLVVRTGDGSNRAGTHLHFQPDRISMPPLLRRPVVLQRADGHALVVNSPGTQTGGNRSKHARS
jgi:hypothetical protein